ncbi:MAG: hypothetical protein WCT14_11270 [Treponemataceae bacterium]
MNETVTSEKSPMPGATGSLTRGALPVSALIVVFVFVAAATGLFLKTDGAPFTLQTVRGETATYAGSGLYRYDPAIVAQEGRIWDAVTLILAVPLAAMALMFAARGSLRGRLLLLGMHFYFFYMYFQYAVMLALNPLFLVYVAIFALCPIAFGLTLSGLDIGTLPSRVSPRFPRRLFVGFSATMGAALLLMWTARIAAILRSGKFGAELAGLGTLETQAFDLGLVVPLCLSSAVLLAKRKPFGYFLAAVSLTFGVIMCVTIPAWIAVPIITRGAMNPLEAIPFLILCVVGLALGIAFYGNVEDAKRH